MKLVVKNVKINNSKSIFRANIFFQKKFPNKSGSYSYGEVGCLFIQASDIIAAKKIAIERIHKSLLEDDSIKSEYKLVIFKSSKPEMNNYLINKRANINCGCIN